MCSKSDTSGKRIYDKRHYCLFCGSTECKVARHIQGVHQDELIVKQILHLKDVKKRYKKWSLLRFKGDYYCTINFLKTGGEFVVWRCPRPNDTVDPIDYVPSKYCFTFIKRKDMWCHCLFQEK